MTDDLLADITITEEVRGGTVYDFPARPLGKWRWMGLLPLAFGIGIIAFVTFWTIGFVGGMRQVFGDWGWLGLIAAIPFATGALTVITIGLAVMMGRARLTMTESHLLPVERIGWFPWMRRRIPREKVARLVVQSGASARINGEQQQIPAFEAFSVLMAETHHGKKHILVPGYPREWLLGLANHLSRQLAIDPDATDASPEFVPVDVVDLTTQGQPDPDRWEQPAGSRVDHQQLDDGCIFTIPAPGIWKGSKGLFFFSLLWCGFMVLFTGGVAGAFAGGNPPKDEAAWIFPLFIAGFWAIGIGMMVTAINMGRRQAAIAVTNGTMKSIVSGMFGTTRKEWSLSELQTARMGTSGMEVNDVPVMQLHIVPRTGSKYGLLTGLDEPELEWIATHLRRYIPNEPGDDTADRNPG